jgi:hypothetical protein
VTHPVTLKNHPPTECRNLLFECTHLLCHKTPFRRAVPPNGDNFCSMRCNPYSTQVFTNQNSGDNFCSLEGEREGSHRWRRMITHTPAIKRENTERSSGDNFCSMSGIRSQLRVTILVPWKGSAKATERSHRWSKRRHSGVVKFCFFLLAFPPTTPKVVCFTSTKLLLLESCDNFGSFQLEVSRFSCTLLDGSWS